MNGWDYLVMWVFPAVIGLLLLCLGALLLVSTVRTLKKGR